MFLTAEELQLSKEEINRISEQIYSGFTQSKCGDCGVSVGEKHEEGCDIAICQTCGGQALMCECEFNPDTWTGLFPGVKECYEQKLICFDNSPRPFGGQWCFDLNKWYLEKK